jgi:hypothetical protein
MHVAPLATVSLGPTSTFRYRYWLVVGTAASMPRDLDALWEKYGAEGLTATP